MNFDSRLLVRLGYWCACVFGALGISTSVQAQGGNFYGGDSKPILDIEPLVGSVVAPEMHAPLTLGDTKMSAEDKARIEKWTDRLPLAGPKMSGGSATPPPAGSATEPFGPQPLAANTFKLWSNTNLLPTIPGGFSSSTNEPATAMAGRNRFQTGNWYAVYSSNQGNTWTSLSPFTAFPSIDGGFCCDQDTIYDPSRGMFIWFLQYIKSGSGAGDKGSIRIALWNSNVQNISNVGWYTYTYDPTDFGGAGGEWFDYPHIALSNDYLYIAINVFTTTTDQWTRTLMIRLPLREMRYQQAFAPVYFQSTNYFNFTPVQGAKDVMYFASQVNGNSMVLFRWPETAGVSLFGKGITPYLAGGTHNCPAVGGNDWCQRSDNRIGAGAIVKNALTKQQELWWFWNVRQGGIFTYPYIEAAKFRESDLTYIGRPLLWSANGAYHYIGAAPNARGDIALSVAFGHPPNRNPGSMVCLDDDFNGDPAPWECYTTMIGAFSPASNRWGDYLRVRPADPADFNWTATAFTLQANTASGAAEARNLIFGRERDAWQYFRWWNR